MFEIDARGGLGRRGRWTRGERTLTTPLVLFLQGGARAAPSYAEGLLVSERTEDPRFQVRVGGSFFAPRPANDPDDLPAAKGIPLALADLEIPHEAVAGDWAVVSGESDLVAAKAVPGVFIANGPEFERSPREFVSAIREMVLVRNHLVHGRLRELVGRRLAKAPWNTAVVRHLDLREYDLVEPYTPVAGGQMRAYAAESLARPEIVRFRRRIRERYVKPASARVLLLLPCSARKPYSTSRSHRRFRDAILASANPTAVHEVIVTSPLGLIPRELERFYPAGAYDIPVTGDWSRDEAAMVTEDLRAFLAANQYETVVAHLAAEAPIVKAAAPDAIPTSKERPTSDESLASLTQTLNHATASAPRVPKGRRFSEEMSNVARFQFGEAGLGLVRGASFRGRMPDVRLIREGTQVAMHTGRGMLSLTLRGGAILSQADAYWVEIEDFLPKGNIFAVGVVDAAPEIRPGDEVVVRHQKDVRAVGTARLSGREMVDFRRGEAVHVRHVIEMPP